MLYSKCCINLVSKSTFNIVNAWKMAKDNDNSNGKIAMITRHKNNTTKLTCIKFWGLYNNRITTKYMVFSKALIIWAHSCILFSKNNIQFLILMQSHNNSDWEMLSKSRNKLTVYIQAATCLMQTVLGNCSAPASILHTRNYGAQSNELNLWFVWGEISWKNHIRW